MYNEVSVKRESLLFLHDIVISGKFIVIHFGKVGGNEEERQRRKRGGPYII